MRGIHVNAKSGIFVWGGQVATLIYLSRQPHTHIYIRFFIIYTFFYLISYIYTHTKQQQKELSNFNQIMFGGDLTFNKIHFIVKFFKKIIFDTNYQILYLSK